MKAKLTDTAIKAALGRAVETAQRQELVDETCPGLRLRITPSGTRSWVLACRDSLGAMRRFPLGRHPKVGLAEARDAARSTREKVRHGADPIADARRKRAIGRDARQGIGTLGALLDLYAKQQGSAQKSWPECRRRIESVFRAHVGKPLAALTPGDLQLTADSHRSQQSAAAAVRYIRPVLGWANAPGRSYIPSELASIRPPATVKRRGRVLTRDELTRLLPVLRTSDRPYAAAMRLMILTLTRREEAATALWKHVDLVAGTWTLVETKNKQPHVVPLSHQAVALLREQLPRNKADQPVKLAPTARVFASKTGAPLSNWDRETKALMAASGTSKWTRHDLRRTAATMLGDMGELPDIIEAALNHVAIRSQLAATYNRSRYRPQVAAALQRLADALDGIEHGGAEVVQLRHA